MAKELSGTLSELVVERDMIFKSIDGLKSDIDALKAVSKRHTGIKSDLAGAIARLQRMLREDEQDLKRVMKSINEKQLSFLDR